MFIMGDILADTAILSNASKKEPLCSCYEHTSRVCLQLNGIAAVWALSARKICQHATILEGQSWALDCFCHCDVFSTINWLLSFLDLLSNAFIFLTSESIICRKWHISIFTTLAKQSMINRLSNPINRNRSAAKISKVMSSNWDATRKI